MNCDFCYATDPPVEFLCKDFQCPDPLSEHTSEGSWLACTTCAQLVNDEHWPELEARMVDPEMTDVSFWEVPILKKYAHDLLMKFRDNRINEWPDVIEHD